MNIHFFYPPHGVRGLTTGWLWTRCTLNATARINASAFVVVVYSGHYDSALVHHSDPSGRGSGSNCHQRPGGRSCKQSSLPSALLKQYWTFTERICEERATNDSVAVWNSMFCLWGLIELRFWDLYFLKCGYCVLFLRSRALLLAFTFQARHRMDKEINNRKCEVLLDGRSELAHVNLPLTFGCLLNSWLKCTPK